MKTRTIQVFFLLIIGISTVNAQWYQQSDNFTNGHLGIGSAANLNSLYIYGSNSQNLLKVENSRDSDAGIEFESNLANFKIGAGIGNGTNSFTIYDLNALQLRMIINGSGQVGIGTTSPTSGYLLDVNGNLKVGSNIFTSGNVTSFDLDATYVDGYEGDFYNIFYNNLYSSSDKRLKSNIEEDGISHEEIYKVKTYNYQFKDDNEGRKRHGVMAQEIQELLPELVSKDQDGYLAVNYVDMIPLMLRAIQDQKQTIDALQAELSTLKNDIISNQDLAKKLEVEGDFIKVYPNPSNSESKIEILQEGEDSQIQIINLNGEVIKSVKVDRSKTMRLDETNLINGVYFVKYFIAGELKQTKRILVQK